MPYIWLADIVVAVHVAYVACVVFGLFVFLLDQARGWRWLHNRWVRGIHLAMILVVVARSLVWDNCPLTTWEDQLRDLGKQVDLEGSRVGAVLHAVIHPPLPMWSFPVIYALFACLVVATLWIVPVAWRSPRTNQLA